MSVLTPEEEAEFAALTRELFAPRASANADSRERYATLHARRRTVPNEQPGRPAPIPDRGLPSTAVSPGVPDSHDARGRIIVDSVAANAPVNEAAAAAAQAQPARRTRTIVVAAGIGLTIAVAIIVGMSQAMTVSPPTARTYDETRGATMSSLQLAAKDMVYLQLEEDCAAVAIEPDGESGGVAVTCVEVEVTDSFGEDAPPPSLIEVEG